MISVESLTKDYLLLARPIDAVRAALGRSRELKTFRALDNVSFEVKRGEVLGIIGANGAGKSTLLKILSGVLEPTSGKAAVNGRVSSLLEVSTGFNPVLTGRENIRRRLMLHGLSSWRVAELEPQIIEFAELEDVIDQKVITYSSGMSARLAFAIVTAAVNEVVLIDEILTVGDEHFQGKSFKRIRELCVSGRTVVIASHATNYIERLGDRAIWLEKGKVRLEGPAHQVAMAYFGGEAEKVEASYPREYGFIEDVCVETLHDTLEVTTVVRRIKPADNLHVQVAIHDNNLGILAALFNTSWQEVALPVGVGPIRVSVSFPAPVGLRNLLVGVALARGTGAIPGSIIEDSWGWKNNKQVYASRPGLERHRSYIRKSLEWKNVRKS
jgi:ABC-type polysaccharide/polyol phosphate transport system ATPase subunit